MIEFADKFNASSVEFDSPGLLICRIAQQNKVQFEIEMPSNSLNIEKYIEDLTKSSKIRW